MTIADVFKKIKDKRAIGPLLAIMKVNHDMTWRNFQRCVECKPHVMQGLGILKALEAINLLLEMIETPALEDYLKRDALDALSAINNRKALERLYRLIPMYQTNDKMVERIWRVIFGIEEHSKQVCYFCGKAPEIKAIEMTVRPENRKICLACWKDLIPHQNNPDTRSVVKCRWAD
jgi:hypothetical protein